MPRRSFPDPAHLLLVATVLAWAGAFSAIKRLTDDGVAAPDIAIGRYMVAAPGFAIALWLSGGLPGLTRRELGRLVAAGLFVVAGYHLALNLGEADTSAGASSVIVAVAPGLTMLLSVGIGLERFSRRRLAGLALAFAGVLVVVLWGAGQSIGASSLTGSLLVVAAAATFAAYNVLAKPLVSRHSPIAVTAAASLIGMLALLPLGGRTTLHDATGMPAGQWLLIVYLGVVCTLAGYIAWTVALRRVDPSRAVSFIYGIPVAAVLIGSLTLGESVTPWLAAGGLMIVGGVAVTQ
jgi:drug/metabolite transporter (DMT)-like permease